MSLEENLVRIPVGKAILEGNLAMPTSAKGLVLFAHGSGSGRFSPRNQYVAKMLNKAGIATLLIDLLTKEEEAVDMQTNEFRFDIDLLSERLIAATEWIKTNSSTRNLPLGYFGASTGAAAAVRAAAEFPKDVKAVVSRGGRPDLSMEYLSKVKASTLLLVGGRDVAVLELNKQAMKNLLSEKKLEIVPGASHLFEEPGKLEEVAKLSIDWFRAKLS
ncbi:MAG TPA: alpha/beta family hydrolase [Candidatus Bathyarchaeia archaeon]|nr:alpha/beta family hydrolase [Candidatus Bathyarchaeia archaeon]